MSDGWSLQGENAEIVLKYSLPKVPLEMCSHIQRSEKWELMLNTGKTKDTVESNSTFLAS